MTLAAVLCCAMTTTVFTACGDDDDNDTPAERKIVGYQVDYSVSIPQTVFSHASQVTCGNLYTLYDKIEVGYCDENGQEQREVVSNWKWSKTITYKKSLDGYFRLYLTKPASLDVESLPYDYYDHYQGAVCSPNDLVGITVLYSDGTKSAPSGIPLDDLLPKTSYACPKSKLVNYLDIYKTEVKIAHFIFNIQ